MEILLGRGGDDVIMIGHEDDVMNEKVIFFMGFRKCLENDARDLPLIEAERPVVCPANQVVR